MLSKCLFYRVSGSGFSTNQRKNGCWCCKVQNVWTLLICFYIFEQFFNKRINKKLIILPIITSSRISSESFFIMFISYWFIIFPFTDDNPRFAEYFQDHLKDIAAEFFTLLVFCYRDGFDGLEQVVRNKVVSSSVKYSDLERFKVLINCP